MCDRKLPNRMGRQGRLTTPGKEETKSLAVLIDKDSTSARYTQAIFDEIFTLGEANVRQIYRDF